MLAETPDGTPQAIANFRGIFDRVQFLWSALRSAPVFPERAKPRGIFAGWERSNRISIPSLLACPLSESLAGELGP